MIEMLTQWTIEIQRLDTEHLKTLLKLGKGVTRMLEFKDKILPNADKKASS